MGNSSASRVRLRGARLARAEGSGSPEEIRAALEEYAVECSIAKVLASEELGWVVDELVQIHGGYGYIEEYPAARAYRDARIHRIWEGTNEINRLIVTGTLVKRALQGRLDLLGGARRAQEALLAPSDTRAEGKAAGPLGAETALVEGARQVTLLLAGAAVQRFGTDLEEQQELLAGLADLVTGVLIMDSAVVRARQGGERDRPRAGGASRRPRPCRGCRPDRRARAAGALAGRLARRGRRGTAPYFGRSAALAGRSGRSHRACPAGGQPCPGRGRLPGVRQSHQVAGAAKTG